MRDLASICTIEKVWPLEGKDKVQGAGLRPSGGHPAVLYGGLRAARGPGAGHETGTTV